MPDGRTGVSAGGAQSLRVKLACGDDPFRGWPGPGGADVTPAAL